MPKKRTSGRTKTSAGGRAGRKTSTASEEPRPVADRRALERVSSDLMRLLDEQSFETIEEANEFISQFVGTKYLPSPGHELTPLERAQDKMYEAWEARSRKARVRLAREALELSPNCADAYVLLAEETARTPEEALELYEEGMRAGERALGPESFTEGAGHFWGILETRPYMRARAGVAECLWEMGEAGRAVEHHRELLRLNLGDNQGNRYLLAGLLLQEGMDEELGALLKEYGEEASAEGSTRAPCGCSTARGRAGARRARFRRRSTRTPSSRSSCSACNRCRTTRPPTSAAATRARQWITSSATGRTGLTRRAHSSGSSSSSRKQLRRWRSARAEESARKLRQIMGH